MELKDLYKPAFLIVAGIIAVMIIGLQTYYNRVISPKLQILQTRIEENERKMNMHGNTINELMTQIRQQNRMQQQGTSRKPPTSSSQASSSTAPLKKNIEDEDELTLFNSSFSKSA